MPDAFEVIYINRSRTSPVRADLIQSLHTTAALQALGVRIRMYLPPWPGADALEARIAAFGIGQPLDVRTTTFLHHRWKRFGSYRPFIAFYRRALAGAGALYTRWPDISLALADAGYRSSVEIHNTNQLLKQGTLPALVAAHREGLIRWLVPTLHATAAFLAEAGADPKRVCVAPNGADLEAFADLPPFEPANLDRPRVLYAGTLDAARGMSILRTIAERGAAEVTLVGDQKETIEPGSSLSVRPRVPHREVPQLYRDADLVVLPYQRQLVHVNSVCPVKLFEAMAAGRPVIASDIPTIRELVEHMKTAILVDPDDTEAWVAAVESLKRDRELATRLVAAARQRATEFTWLRRAQTIAGCLGWPHAQRSGTEQSVAADSARSAVHVG
jgi:glycosyltransferase involved in cell wall biosynthesis